ncbi:MAG TPA: glutamate--tRNA ligase, partial [Saprospiraceae bacterium]|nr:glutamate--tRNA ligase [Saprospiraceae bacterium]
GWNPGTEQEIFSMGELTDAFSIEKIGKSGARFDYDKARWFNQQYLHATDDATLAGLVAPIVRANGYDPTEEQLQAFCRLMKERVTLLPEFWEKGAWFFAGVQEYDEANIKKRWSAERSLLFHQLLVELEALPEAAWQGEGEALKAAVETFMQANGLKPGDVLPVLRIALVGNMQGPAVFELMAVFGRAETSARLAKAWERFSGVSV